MKKYLLSVLFLAAIGLKAQIVTDRPDQTESALALNKGMFQIETGTLLNIDNYSHEKGWDFNNLLRIGILKGIELRVGHNYLIQQYLAKEGTEKLSGFGDMNAGFKVQLYRSEEEGKFDLALLGVYGFPTGAAAFSSGEFSTKHMVLLSHGINDNFGIGYNVGYQHGDEKGDLVYTVSFAGSLAKNLGGFIEYYGALVNFEEDEHNMDFGLTYLIKNNLQADVSFGFPLMKKPSSNFFSFGFSYLFDKQ